MYAEFVAIILIGISYFAFPGFDWRHMLLLGAQFILIGLMISRLRKE